MSWINPDLQLQNLINLLNGIGNFVGYFNKWTPSDNNIVVSNNETTITSTQNNVSYCYSSISYTDTFTLQATTGSNNTNMVLGISKNLNEEFTNPASLSMEMTDYGLMVDNQSSTSTIYLIVNGQITITINALSLPTVKIVYDGTNTLYFYQNNEEILAFRQTITFTKSIYAVISSFYGGKFSNIVWSGSGSGGGQTELTLAEVLLNGNDAHNLTITNLMNIESGIIYGKTNNLQLCSDSTKSKNLTIQTITSVSSPFFGDPYISLSNQSNTKTSRVFDSIFNPPQTNYYFDYSNSGPTTKIYPATPISIMSFTLQKAYQSFTCNLTKFIFDIDNQGVGGNSIFVKFYLSTNVNALYDDYTGIFTTDDLNTDGNFTNVDNIILTYYNSTNTTNNILYLNAYIANNNSGFYDLNNIQIAGQIISNSLPQVNITPSLI
jgi:hypothetical protein